MLGKLWPLVQPLALFCVYYALFARVFGNDGGFDVDTADDERCKCRGVRTACANVRQAR